MMVPIRLETSRSAALDVGVLAVGELMLTPRGLLALGQRSLRSVRQQVKAVEDVGEEIVRGGREVLEKPLRALEPPFLKRPDQD